MASSTRWPGGPVDSAAVGDGVAALAGDVSELHDRAVARAAVDEDRVVLGGADPLDVAGEAQGGSQYGEEDPPWPVTTTDGCRIDCPLLRVREPGKQGGQLVLRGCLRTLRVTASAA